MNVRWSVEICVKLSGRRRIPQVCNQRKLQRRLLSVYSDANYSRSQKEKIDQEKHLFDLFKNSETNALHIGKFLSALTTTGLKKSDPRLKEMMETLKLVQKEESADVTKLSFEEFRGIIQSSVSLLFRAFNQEFIIPDFEEFTKHIEDIYLKCANNTDGQIACYIPQLARANPDYWAVSICTVDGQRYNLGDVSAPFTIQSCSKPLTYAIALNELGADLVHKYVGQEPSGRNFNELILDHNKKPHNPMINAGAIIVCAVINTLAKPEMSLAEKFDFVMNYFERLSGGDNIGFNNAVYLSEREAADRNYALGFYMREHKCFPKGAKFHECMDFYFQCCSLESTCTVVSAMAATLANGGVCPITEEKILNPDCVRDVLSLMHSCGMYDYSGQFAFKVGLPAKSGVSGAMLLVIPNVMGICLYSPPLDQLGNSCRGVQFCEELVKRFNFHRYDNLKHGLHKIDPRKHKYDSKGLNIVNLLFAAAKGDLATMRRHRLSGMDMTLADYDGRTALHLAAAEGNADCVQFLLETCLVPQDPKDRWGRTPLQEAETFGHENVVQLLRQDRSRKSI